MAQKSNAIATIVTSALALAMLTSSQAIALGSPEFGTKVAEAQRQLDADIKACKPIDVTKYEQLLDQIGEAMAAYNRIPPYSSARIPADLLEDSMAASELAERAKEAAKKCGTVTPQQTQAPDPKTGAPKPKESKAAIASPAGKSTSTDSPGTAVGPFVYAVELYNAAKGKCDTGNMMAARAQMDAAIALQRSALDGALKAGAMAIAENLKTQLKIMEDLYWSIDSSIRKCAPPQVGSNPYLQPEKKASINPMAVAVIAGQAGQGDAPQAGPMPGGWTGMTPVNSPQMGPEIKGFYEEKGHAPGSEMAPSAAVLGIFDKYVPDNPGLGGLESAELGKDFDRFMKTIEPYPEAIKSEADDALHVRLEWTLNGEKIQPYPDTNVDQPELPSNYWTPRPVNVDPDYSGPMEIDLYPNAPIYLGTDTPKPVEPDPAPGGAPLDVVSKPLDVPGLALPANPAMVPVDSEQKLALGGGNIAVNSKPTDPGFTIGSGMEGKIGDANNAAPAPAPTSVSEGSASVYGPPMTAHEKIENASRQYLEARRHCNQFDMRLAQANLEAVYKSQGYSNKAAKKAAEAKLDHEWKAFSTAHPDACLPESLAPKQG